MATIVRRRASFSGQITQNSYNEAQFYVKGTDLMEVARDIQRDVFAFVADTGDVVRATFLIETGPEELLDRSEISGVARFVGVPAASDARYKAEVTKVEVVMEGQFVEGGKGTFYVDGNREGRRLRLSSSSEAIRGLGSVPAECYLRSAPHTFPKNGCGERTRILGRSATPALHARRVSVRQRSRLLPLPNPAAFATLPEH